MTMLEIDDLRGIAEKLETQTLLSGENDMRNAIARMKKLGEDPMVGVLDERPDLGRALQRLAKRLD